MIKIISFTSLLFAILIFSSRTNAGENNANDGPVFKIYKGNLQYGYVVGIMHRLPKGKDHVLSSDIKSIISQSDALVTELGVSQFAASRSKVNVLLDKALQGKTLQDLLDPVTFNEIEDKIKKRYGNNSAAILTATHPWTIANALIQSCGVELSDEITEGKYLIQAEEYRKPIYHLETIEGQIMTLPPVQSEIWQNYLKAAVQLGSKKDCNIIYRKSLDSLADAVYKGNVSDIESKINQSYELFDSREFDKVAIYSRNRHMVDQIQDDLYQGKHYVYVVGIQHVIGANGILKSLQASQFRIESINQN